MHGIVCDIYKIAVQTSDKNHLSRDLKSLKLNKNKPAIASDLHWIVHI